MGGLEVVEAIRPHVEECTAPRAEEVLVRVADEIVDRVDVIGDLDERGAVGRIDEYPGTDLRRPPSDRGEIRDSSGLHLDEACRDQRRARLDRIGQGSEGHRPDRHASLFRHEQREQVGDVLVVRHDDDVPWAQAGRHETRPDRHRRDQRDVRG